MLRIRAPVLASVSRQLRTSAGRELSALDIAHRRHNERLGSLPRVAAGLPVFSQPLQILLYRPFDCVGAIRPSGQSSLDPLTMLGKSIASDHFAWEKERTAVPSASSVSSATPIVSTS